MKFAATFLSDPPPDQLVSRARKLESAGFDYVFLNEAQTLFMDPWPVFAHIAAATRSISIGPCVTNPTLRDPVVTAALLATLNEMSSGRMVCGIGRGDAAPRTLGRRPATVAELGEAIRVIRGLVTAGSARVGSREVTLRWNRGWPLEIWGAGYGPRALGMIGSRCDGFIVQAAHEDFLELARSFVAGGTGEADPAAPLQAMVAAPALVGDMDRGCDKLRWFVPSVANHVAELSDNYEGPLPAGMTGLLTDRSEYDYQTKGRMHNPGADYVTPEMTRAFTFVGPPEAHIARIGRFAELGVDAVNLYLIHDEIDTTIDAYGCHIIPAFR